MDFLEAPLIVFLVVVVPLWIIFHYSTQWKKAKGLTAADEATLDELRRTAEKMEERVHVLERILDDEIPDWRSRRHDNV